MFRLERCLLTVVLLQLALINAQLDPDVCSGGGTMISDPRWRFSTDRLEIVTELIDPTMSLEVTQTLAPSRDAVSIRFPEAGLSLFPSDFSSLTFFNLKRPRKSTGITIPTKTSSLSLSSRAAKPITHAFEQCSRQHPKPVCWYKILSTWNHRPSWGSTLATRRIPVELFSIKAKPRYAAF